MIKRALCFSHPAYLSLRNGQLVVKLEKHDDEPEKQATIPIEDIDVVVLDHRQITLTHGVMAALLDNNAAVKCRRAPQARQDRSPRLRTGWLPDHHRQTVFGD